MAEAGGVDPHSLQNSLFSRQVSEPSLIQPPLAESTVADTDRNILRNAPLVHSERLERSTPKLKVSYSNQLSYECIGTPLGIRTQIISIKSRRHYHYANEVYWCRKRESNPHAIEHLFLRQASVPFEYSGIRRVI